MKIFMILVFGLATARTLVPLAHKENYRFSTLFVAGITTVAYCLFLDLIVS